MDGGKVGPSHSETGLCAPSGSLLLKSHDLTVVGDHIFNCPVSAIHFIVRSMGTVNMRKQQ